MLSVTGILFCDAPPHTRSAFSFTPERLADALVTLKRESRAEGVVLLSTCDRIELYLDGGKIDGFEPLCRTLSLPVLQWKPYAYHFEGNGAVDHLFELASGLHSPLFAEDIIISQVEEARTLSRESGCASALLQQLFRLAVTAAKCVQSRLDGEACDPDLPPALLPYLQEKENILVIGSSVTARAVSSYLVSLGKKVTMTLRDERKTELVPSGVTMASYDDRYAILHQFDCIISATKGIAYSLDADAPVRKGQLLVDLAVPADIDPALGKTTAIVKEADLSYPRNLRGRFRVESLKLIRTKEAEFFSWLERETKTGDVDTLSETISQDMVYRMHAMISSLPVSDEEKLRFSTALSSTAAKSVLHGLYERKQSHHADLSLPFVSGKALYPGDPDVVVEPFATIGREGWNLSRIVCGSHSLTHVDAPYHLFPDGKKLRDYPLSRFFGNALVSDDPALRELPETVTMVLFSKVDDLPEETARFLIDGGITLVGVDNDGFSLPLHRLFLSHDVLLLENLSGLEPLVGHVVSLSVSPLPLEGDGAPCRVIASW
jgi:glutamyl-tRNA reductase